MLSKILSPFGYKSQNYIRLKRLSSLPVTDIQNLKNDLMTHNNATAPTKEIALSLFLQAKIKQYETHDIDIGCLEQGEKIILTIDELNEIHNSRQSLNHKKYCKLKVTAIVGTHLQQNIASSLLKEVSKKSTPQCQYNDALDINE